MSGDKRVIELVPRSKAPEQPTVSPTDNVVAWLKTMIERIESGELPAPTHAAVLVLATEVGPAISTHDGEEGEALDLVRTIGLLQTASHCVLDSRVVTSDD